MRVCFVLRVQTWLWRERKGTWEGEVRLIRWTVSYMTAEMIIVTLQIKQSKIHSTAEPGLALADYCSFPFSRLRHDAAQKRSTLRYRWWNTNTSPTEKAFITCAALTAWVTQPAWSIPYYYTFHYVCVCVCECLSALCANSCLIFFFVCMHACAFPCVLEIYPDSWESIYILKELFGPIKLPFKVSSFCGDSLCC